MKNIARFLLRTMLSAAVVLQFFCLSAQQAGRYLEPVFDRVLVTSEIKYSSAIREGDDTPTLLYLDFYEPSGDTLGARPLVITVFGGAFVTGSRDYVDMVEYGHRLAKLGYVVASIDYRLLPILLLNSESLIRAAYKGAQDVSSAVRFFKLHSSEYRIDTNNIFLLGNSAGSIASIHEVFLNDDERPVETFSEPDAGPLHGEGFHDYAYISPKVSGIVAHWGGVMDVNIIDPEEYVPICMIHGTEDKVVPYDSGYCYSEYAASLSPYMYGSHTIAAHLDNLGITDYEFHPFEGLGHCFYIWGLAFLDEEKFNSCYEITKNFLYDHLSAGNTENINARPSADRLHVYPNPAEDFVTVDLGSVNDACNVSLHDHCGRMVKMSGAMPCSDGKITFPVSDLPSGLYFLHITDNKGFSAVSKLLVK